MMKSENQHLRLPNTLCYVNTLSLSTIECDPLTNFLVFLFVFSGLHRSEKGHWTNVRNEIHEQSSLL